MQKHNIVGQRFGRLIALGRDPEKYKSNYTLVKCDCGTHKSVKTTDLINGKTKSCGCLRAEMNAQSMGREKRNFNSRVYNTAIKTEVLTHYGPNESLQCSFENCEIKDIDMLSLDHVGNDGANDRRSGRKQTGVALYGLLKREGFPEGFSTLCFNHQMKKDLEIRRRKAEVGTVLRYIIPMMYIGAYGKDLSCQAA